MEKISLFTESDGLENFIDSSQLQIFIGMPCGATYP
jgi:hypothetical protein